MAGDVIKLTGPNIYLPATKVFLQKQAVITTTMTKHLQCFYLFYTLLTKLPPKKKNFLMYLFFILHLDSCSANKASNRVMPVSHILSLRCDVWHIFPTPMLMD